MDKELGKRWLKLPTVEVEPSESLLLVNRKFVSLPDVTPGDVSDFISIGQQAIDAHLLEMRKRYRYWGSVRSRPSILVGRLALNSNETEVISREGLRLKSEADFSITHLVEDYQEYWIVIEESIYKPVIHRHTILANPKLDGTWLGLRRP